MHIFFGGAGWRNRRDGPNRPERRNPTNSNTNNGVILTLYKYYIILMYMNT